MGELFGFAIWLALSAALATFRHRLRVTLRARRVQAANGRTKLPSEYRPHPYYERGSNG